MHCTCVSVQSLESDIIIPATQLEYWGFCFVSGRWLVSKEMDFRLWAEKLHFKILCQDLMSLLDLRHLCALWSIGCNLWWGSFFIVQEILNLPKKNVVANEKHLHVHQVLLMNIPYLSFQAVFIFRREVKTSKEEIFNVVFYTLYHFQVLWSLKTTVHEHSSAQLSFFLFWLDFFLIWFEKHTPEYTVVCSRRKKDSLWKVLTW